jgi:ankyrin repeat protein
MTALGIACSKKELLSIAKLLVEKGADIDWTTHDGIGAMYHAIRHDNYMAIKMLVKKGALLFYHKRAKRDNSPLFYAIK